MSKICVARQCWDFQRKEWSDLHIIKGYPEDEMALAEERTDQESANLLAAM